MNSLFKNICFSTGILLGFAVSVQAYYSECYEDNYYYFDTPLYSDAGSVEYPLMSDESVVDYSYDYEDTFDNCLCHDPYSEVYLGAIGYGVKLRPGCNGYGLDDYFGERGSKVNGTLWGFVVGYTYRKPCCLYFNSEVEWASGDTSKKRCLEDTPSRDLENVWWTNRLGYNFACRDGFTITPYGGVGYRYSHHHLHRSDLELFYQNWFGIAGGRIDWQYNSCLSIGFNGQGYIPFDSTLKLKHFSKKFNLDDEYGYQLEIPIKYTFCKCCNHFSLSLIPFYRRMIEGKSKEHTCGAETLRAPKIKNEEYGAKLYVGYLF